MQSSISKVKAISTQKVGSILIYTFIYLQATFVICATLGIRRAIVVIWNYPALVLTPCFGTWTFGPKFKVQDAFIMGIVFVILSPILGIVQGDTTGAWSSNHTLTNLNEEEHDKIQT